MDEEGKASTSSMEMTSNSQKQSDEQSCSPKSLLEQISKLNETVPASQIDESFTIALQPKEMTHYSRRSSGILATVQTPKTLLQNFLNEGIFLNAVLIWLEENMAAKSRD
ncbi:hypothetical protein Ahia01_000212600 [Argonauta hians]